MASPSIVIKVRFGETLRRLNASVNDKKLVLDFAMLKEKIRGLFSFGSDVEFTLTYVDEDGDTVTLADDDDLQDVVRQCLNPLRITVSLTGSSFSGSSGSSTPLMSPQSQLPFRNLNPRVSEVLKSIPEPLLEALAKLPLELASKASSSAPRVAELVEKMKDLYSSQIILPMGSSMVHHTTDGSSNVNAASSTVKDSKVQVNAEAEGSNTKKTARQVQKVTESVKYSYQQPSKGDDRNNPYFEYESFQAPISSTGKNKNITDDVERKKNSTSEKKDGTSNGSLNEPLKQDGLASLQYNEQLNQMREQLQGKMAAQTAQFAQVADDINKSTNDSGSSSSWPQGLLMSQHLQDKMAAQQAQFAKVAADFNKNTNDSGNSSSWAQGMLNAANQCPFSGMPLTSDSDSQGYHRRSRSPHWKRYSLDNNGMGSIFHRGVRCDGCGAHPITGPRFKSKVKDDYDLCNVCFARMGNAADYIKMDRPTNGFRHQFTPSKGFYDPALRIPTPTLPHAMQVPTMNASWPKLDSRFILDVNVLDGTIMAPFTAFTKIWRMRNNGSLTWPYGSQLQWIGGDRLSNSLSVNVEIPVDGLQVDKELDIAVDFTAPELPGRYVSYWRMAAPSGQKFGQRVWVLIQVDASLKNLGETSINLNKPPVVRDPVAFNHDYLVDNIFSGNNITTASENTTGAHFRTNDSLIAENTSLVHSPVNNSPIAENTSAVHVPTNDSMIIDDGYVSSTTANLSAPPETGSSPPPVLDCTEVETFLKQISLKQGRILSRLATSGSSHPAEPPATSGFSPKTGTDTEPISYPTVDFSVIPPVMSSGAESLPPVAVQPSGSDSKQVSANKEQALVKDLEQMGFKQLDLNKEVLRMNNYDMEKSIDDLCGSLEWDPMLDELREMGFVDDEVNRRLLKKNNGSIKRVVMDLIYDEKA